MLTTLWRQPPVGFDNGFRRSYKAARRVNFLIGKDGKILEEQIHKDAIDPTKIVDACQRPKSKN